MTKADYADVRDRFTAALRALRDVEDVFCTTALDTGKLPEEWDGDGRFEMGRALDEYGSWLPRDRYIEVVDAIDTLTFLVGLAHERAA